VYQPAGTVPLYAVTGEIRGLSGGGFGGCVITLVREDDVEVVSDAVRHRVVDNGYPDHTLC